MTNSTGISINQFASHAVCMAASARDVMRTAQFYTRDMSNVDGANKPERAAPTFLSSVVAKLARLADHFISWSSATAIKLLLPSWRNLPSPFEPNMLAEVTNAIAKNSLVHNPLFNSYFFRAASHITQHYSEPPYLILEHRVDAARRQLASQHEQDFLATALIALVENGAVARIGTTKNGAQLFKKTEPNVAVFSIACVALLFAQEGKPNVIQNEDDFFAIVGALIMPRLEKISALITAHNAKALTAELQDIKSMY
jgi:hypothetical protein